MPGHADLLKRQEELERKEAELARRERQIDVSIFLVILVSYCLLRTSSDFSHNDG